MNIAEKLKDVPKGTKLYSPIFGDVTFKWLHDLGIKVLDSANVVREFYNDGRFYMHGECMLFPSRDNRDWSTFTLNKFDINSFKPFDKVLIRDGNEETWRCGFYSHYRSEAHFKYWCTSYTAYQCIPYNDETKHLIGTKEDCPDYYKTW